MKLCAHPREKMIWTAAPAAVTNSSAVMKTFVRVTGLLLLAFALVGVVQAGTIPITVTLDPNWGDYHWYSYTGGSAPLPTGPYPAIMTGGIYGSGTLAYLSCFDINVDTYIGHTYFGSLTDPTDTAQDPTQLEVSWLMNELSLLGGYHAPVDTVSGPLSMAIWQVENLTSINQKPFTLDPAAQPWVNDAINAVSSGAWTAEDAAQHPFWTPDDLGASQRFGIVSAAPEPGSSALVGASLIGLGLLVRKRLKRN